MSCDDFKGRRKEKLKEAAEKCKGRLSSDEFFVIMREGLLSMHLLGVDKVKELLSEVLDSDVQE